MARWSDSAEGWRTTCPDCGKICAVGPTSKTIQTHQKSKSSAKKAAVVKQKIDNSAIRDLLYAEIYEDAFEGISRRPQSATERKFRDVFEMAYLDGLSDGGHTMMIGAFKRWLSKN